MAEACYSSMKKGLTLIELLVAIGIIGLLIGITLPAVQASRAASRKIECVNNLKMLGLGTHNYETSYGVFPSSSTGLRGTAKSPYGLAGSVHLAILPQIHSFPLYNSLNMDVAADPFGGVGEENATVAEYVFGFFLCPADPGTQDRGGCNSYRANVGLCVSCPEEGTGAFFFGGANTLSGFKDGLANTLCFSEKLVGTGVGGNYSSIRDWIQSEDLPRTADGWVRACSGISNKRVGISDAGSTWLLSGSIYTSFFVATPPNGSVPDCGNYHDGGTGIFTARSFHQGGVNALMCDGSVRWVSSSINKNVWRSLGSRNGGEVISAIE